MTIDRIEQNLADLGRFFISLPLLFGDQRANMQLMIANESESEVEIFSEENQNACHMAEVFKLWETSAAERHNTPREHPSNEHRHMLGFVMPW